MTLYVTAKTDIDDLVIDFIEVRLKSGEVVSLNWDMSGIDPIDGGFSAKYSGVCFDEQSAEGQLEQLRDMCVVGVGLYSERLGEGNFPLTIETMEFCDEDKTLTFDDVYQSEETKPVYTAYLEQLYNKFLSGSRR